MVSERSARPTRSRQAMRTISRRRKRRSRRPKSAASATPSSPLRKPGGIVPRAGGALQNPAVDQIREEPGMAGAVLGDKVAEREHSGELAKELQIVRQRDAGVPAGLAQPARFGVRIRLQKIRQPIHGVRAHAVARRAPVRLTGRSPIDASAGRSCWAYWPSDTFLQVAAVVLGRLGAGGSCPPGHSPGKKSRGGCRASAARRC